MRNVLILIILIISMSSYADDRHVPLPFEIDGGRAALEALGKKNRLKGGFAIQAVNENVMVLYRSAGSGRALVDIYVYGCVPSWCSLIALRRSLPVDVKMHEPLNAEILRDGYVLSVRSGGGIEQFRVAIPGDKYK